MKARVESLNGDRKKINACRKAGLPLHHPIGKWNGYGYEQFPLAVTLSTIGEIRIFKRILREVEMAPMKKIVSYADKKEKWCKRLCSFTGISFEEAKQIVEEKEEYKEKQITWLEAKQFENYSRKREVLINQIRRSNPLRDIKDSEHAHNILTADKRHNNTNYHSKLEEGRELAQIGEIDKSEVKDYARRRIYEQ